MIPRLYMYAACAAGALVVVSGIYLKGRSDGKESARAAYAAQAAKAQAAAYAKERESAAISARIEAQHIDRTRDLQARINLLMRDQSVIRLRLDAGTGVPTITTAAPGPDAGTAGQGQDLRDGRDIGGDALVLAGKCEADRQKLIALQEYIREVM